MKLSTLMSSINVAELRGPADGQITGITYDSRSVNKGFLFLAQDGEHVDGHYYIDQAIASGAACIVHSKDLTHYTSDVTYIKVKNSRTVLSPIAARFYGNPSAEITCVGITGTNGKSTTAYFLYQLLKGIGCDTGLLSTVAVDIENELEKNPLRKSTADASEIQEDLRAMVKSRKQYAVVEATSHGLSNDNNRLGDVEFVGGVFTNISHEHLNFHGTFERYLDAKANLFRRLHASGNGFGIVNANDRYSQYMIDAASVPVYSYSISAEADLTACNVMPNGTGFRFTAKMNDLSIDTAIELPGDFNIENALAAALTAFHLVPETQPPEIFSLLPSLVAPIGRMKQIRNGQDFSVFVDYAHSPDSFKKILPLFREATEGRLIAVFGSAGEGDVEKRPVQGKIASDYCDVLVLTDEDPRGEDSMAIITDIASGCVGMKQNEDLFLIPDRQDAIFHAISLARNGDTVLLLGKGHESTIVMESGAVPWNEEEIALQALSALI